MNKTKYIAAGFANDANKLLKSFVESDSVEFPSFADIWKKNNFYYIFMGRPTEKELREFINEMYQLTWNYVVGSAIKYQIGGIYLLYALFRTQDIIAPVRIRITEPQFETLIRLQIHAEENKYRTLHYVIEYLCDNALEYVAATSLHGPCSARTRINWEKQKIQSISLLSELKRGITSFKESNVLNDLKDLHIEYLKKKGNIYLSKEVIPNTIAEYDKFSEKLDTLITGTKRLNVETINPVESIGTRRAQIKQAQFQRKAMFRSLNPDEDISEISHLPAPPIKMRKRISRIAAQKRRVGRPKKEGHTLSEESESSDDQIPIKIEAADSIPKRRGPIGRKRVSYLHPFEGLAIFDVPKQKIDVSNTSEEFSDNEILKF